MGVHILAALNRRSGEMVYDRKLPVSRPDASLDRQSSGQSIHSRGSRVGVLLRIVLALCCLAVLLPKLRLHALSASRRAAFAVERMTNVCPQTGPITPTTPGLLEELENEFATDEFRSHAYESLSGAIRIPYVLLTA